MTDLFPNHPTPRRLKVGQGNGEFLAALATMTPAQRAKVTPADFPDATPAIVRAEVLFHTTPTRTAI